MAKTKKIKKPQEVLPQRSNKEQRLFDNLLRVLEQFMMGKSYVPLSQGELMTRLTLPPQHEPVLNEALQTLTKLKKADLTNGKYTWKKKDQETVSGVLRLHPRGFGFLQVENSQYDEDIFIPKHLTQNAVDGDQVEVVVNPDSMSEKGPEGKVIAILSRGRTHLAGIILTTTRGGNALAFVPLLGTSQRVLVQTDPTHPLKVGDRIIMEVIDWGKKDDETLCKYSHYIGHISDPSCDIKAAIEEYGIRSDFPTKVVAEAEEYGTSVARADMKNREDLREVECFTIDPDTAKDFDDALTVSKKDNGNYELGVHIADVSHYVAPGTALDAEASIRCNSTYFPGTCVPMLPNALSDNLCSLKPNVNRLTVSVFMEFDPSGTLVTYRIAKSVIKSAKRFTYKEAKQVLDGTKKSKHAPTLHLMVELCNLLKRKRFDRGSIEFAMPELMVLVDKSGIPTGTDYIEYDITHQMVEEFMLKANEMVAWHLTNQGRNVPFRVHDEPSEDNLKDFAMLARTFGYDLSDKPTPAELQRMFQEAHGSPYAQYLATSYIRRMRLAVYSPENIGHYGLALTHYCHFTSPIRRYVDLVAHRLLFGENDDIDILETIAKRCSDQERVSAKAEGGVLVLKKLRLLKERQDKEPHRQYEAIVTKVKPHGITFEIVEYMLEGFLHVSELESDYYAYDEVQKILKGRRTGGTYVAGDKITVLLKEADFITLESRWHLVEGPAERKVQVGKKLDHKSKSSKRKGDKRSGDKKSGRREKNTFEHKPKAPLIEPVKTMGVLPPVNKVPVPVGKAPFPARRAPLPARKPFLPPHGVIGKKSRKK